LVSVVDSVSQEANSATRGKNNKILLIIQKITSYSYKNRADFTN